MKEALVADGRWREFVRYRDERVADGVPRQKAHNMAIAAVCPEFASKAPMSGRKPKDEASRAAREAAAVATVVEAADAVDELDARKAKRDAERLDRLGLGDLSKLPADFWKRECSTAEAFWWAMKKAKLGIGRVEDSPGDKALVLYALFMDSPDATVDVSRQVLSKLIAKDDGDTGGADRFDGQAEYDLLAAMEEVAG